MFSLDITMTKKMPSTKIESLAVTAINAEIDKYDSLASDIEKMDKNPIWDGHIYVYAEEIKNEKYYDRIPIQIKGKTVLKFSDSSTKHDIRINDLVNFKKEYGTLYFVVEIHKDTREARIFCKMLLPYDIDEILRKIEGKQKTKSIEISRLRGDSLDTICMNFIENSKKQTGRILKETDIKGVKEIECGIVLKSDNRLDKLLDLPIYEYAIDDNETTFPISKKQIIEIDAKMKDAEIKAGDNIYYTKFVINHKPKESYIKIGESLKLYDCGEIIFELSENISQGRHDLNFVMDALQNGGFWINGKLYPLQKSPEHVSCLQI
ncbi:MAG: hypothetical protein LBE57_06370 [Methanosarcinales archaeon]|jgi:hypothetical protein|nr:hypothetical protein [Methanosarcinales archaeon]